MVSPLVCQTLRARGYSWRNFFYISLGLAVISVSYSLFAFQPTESEFQIEKQLTLASQALTLAKEDEKAEATPLPATREKIGMLQIFSMPYVWTIAVFLGVYQGAETIAQGFIVTFLLHERVSSIGPSCISLISLSRMAILILWDMPPVVSKLAHCRAIFPNAT